MDTEKPRLAPKFLTRDIAHFAMVTVARSVFQWSQIGVKRQACHLVLLVPTMKDDRATEYADYPNYNLEPNLLYEWGTDNKEEWTAKYDEIAKCKALQLWHDRNDGRTDIMPHLLYAGDAPFWGGVKREGIVVACSGVQPWYDKMIAGMVTDMIIGMTYNEWMKSKDREIGVEFLS